MAKMQEKGQSFVVVVRRDGEVTEIIGPYRSFKKAEGWAKANDGWGKSTCVEPLVKPETI